MPKQYVEFAYYMLAVKATTDSYKSLPRLLFRTKSNMMHDATMKPRQPNNLSISSCQCCMTAIASFMMFPSKLNGMGLLSTDVWRKSKGLSTLTEKWSRAHSMYVCRSSTSNSMRSDCLVVCDWPQVDWMQVYSLSTCSWISFGRWSAGIRMICDSW